MKDLSISNQSELDNFLCPRSRYYGQFSPQKLAFNANLQEFSRRVDYICALGTNGKLTSTEAYSEIKQLWKALKKSKKCLAIGMHDIPPEDV
ncbi:MAG: hypothetical protein F6K11_14885 [Leptolyngbya sp. SIO3F4]|nr:hypothetical protein [Leptolyngbya sp. SIO3F4]